MNIQEITEALKAKGVKVNGLASEFFSEPIDNEGLWISGEGCPTLFNYYSERWYDSFGVEPKLNEFVEDNGWYFEWYDAGTIMLWKD